MTGLKFHRLSIPSPSRPSSPSAALSSPGTAGPGRLVRRASLRDGAPGRHTRRASRRRRGPPAPGRGRRLPGPGAHRRGGCLGQAGPAVEALDHGYDLVEWRQALIERAPLARRCAGWHDGVGGAGNAAVSGLGATLLAGEKCYCRVEKAAAHRRVTAGVGGFALTRGRRHKVRPLCAVILRGWPAAATLRPLGPARPASPVPGPPCSSSSGP